MINKKITPILIVLILVFSLSNFVSAEEVEMISFIADWEVGDSQQYEKTETIWKNNVINQTSTLTFTVEVLDAWDEGYLFVWKDQKILLPPDMQLDAMTEGIIRLGEAMEIQYVTDIYGSYLDLVNLEDLSKQMEIVMNMFLEKMETDEEKAMFTQIMNALIGSDDQKRILFSKDMHLMHNPFMYSYEYEKDMLYEGEVELPNPWGGEQFIGYIEVTATKDTDGTNVIEIYQTLDRDQSAEILKQTLKSLGANIPEITEDMFDQIDISDHFVYKFNGKWVNELTHTRSVSIMGQTRVDEKVIRKL